MIRWLFKTACTEWLLEVFLQLRIMLQFVYSLRK
jgi:hypothetical protein